jgi:hypothetical protein
MLTRFMQVLKDVERQHPRLVTIIDTQGTLDRHPKWWHNELHPNAKGFDAFVKLFAAQLRQLYPGRFP